MKLNNLDGTAGPWKGRLAREIRPGQASWALAALVLATVPGAALGHQTVISDDVGGTHHIEPSDTPRAGELSQTWFALTQAGGTTIGLSDCDCELQLLSTGGAVIASPELDAIAVEGLTDVPAAEVTFPKVGAYVLALSGEPQNGATFSPFTLEFPVTVAAGAAAVPVADVSSDQTASLDEAAAENAEGGEPERPAEVEEVASRPWGWLIAGGVVAAAAAVVLWGRKPGGDSGALK